MRLENASGRSILAIAAVIISCRMLASHDVSSAASQFQALTSQMRDAHKRADWQIFRARAAALSQLLNGSPDALLEVARADAQLGDDGRALELLRQFAEMGESNDVVKTLPEFARLRQHSEFQSVLDQMQSNLRPLTHATLAFEIPDAGLLPEDIDYDPQSRRFFLSSVLENKIVSIGADHQMADFARAPDHWPVLALKIDARRRLLWATEVALEQFSNVAKTDWGRSALLSYDLQRGNRLRRIEGPPHSALGDMALTANGDVVVSDGAGGGVYLAQGDSLKRIDKGDFISPQTPACAPDDTRVLIPDYERGIGVITMATGQVHWFSTEGKYAFHGIDGMYLYRGRLIAVQNGTSPERVIAFDLTPNLSGVRSAEVIEAATDKLDPTHGVMVGNEFYYIANSGWSALEDTGKLKNGAALTKARIMRTNAFK